MAELESEVQEATAQASSSAGSTAPVIPVSDGITAAQPPAPLAQPPCPTCGSNGAAMPASYVYALGRLDPRFPRLSVEKEFAQATGRAETVNLTDRQALRQDQEPRGLAVARGGRPVPRPAEGEAGPLPVHVGRIVAPGNGLRGAGR